MKIAPLHNAFIAALQRRLNGWRFVAKHRHFRITRGNVTWFLHVAFINHAADFDATVNVAVEFLKDKKRVCIVGAELGNIHGSGQRRYPVSSLQEAEVEADKAVEDFKAIGLPFLETYSQPQRVIQALVAGGGEARLISPFSDMHSQQIAALKNVEHAV